MEHEVFVPVPAERLREVLDDPARVARAVPGLQQDAGAEPVAGRLKIRVGSHSVTYRGAVRVLRRDDDAYAVEGEVQEARGSGSVRFALRIALRETTDGCTLVYDGTASADGRITDLPADAVEGAVTRLLNRFAEQLAATAVNGDDEAPKPPAGADAGEGAQAPADAGLTEEAPAPERPSVFGADVPPSPLGPAGEDKQGNGAGEDDEEDIAEAAHARRTMIGRSAEEVDHAPPRGRYAPVPAPQTVTPAAPLRWAAPAAALALASAVVAVRALRRRR
ncbi:SRPBCC domain-containing protein [Streptomyces sp. 378]|uniref:SRPBCC domain-containing protein n=1 Tax=Streptomyces sp. 378 TaxID=3049412 RepID=UPI0024C3C189|nr:SRPBCC domain-containing protein [Streptomyces sp. 378]MDK1341985.1 SRPBCC domain-containing protein [Streptomyces sp. 378]